MSLTSFRGFGIQVTRVGQEPSHDSDICSIYEKPHSYSLINIFAHHVQAIGSSYSRDGKPANKGFKMVPILWDRGGLWWNLTPQSPVNVCSPHTLHQCTREKHMIRKAAPTAFQPCEIEEKAEVRRCKKKYQIFNVCDETNSNIIMNKKKTTHQGFLYTGRCVKMQNISVFQPVCWAWDVHRPCFDTDDMFFLTNYIPNAKKLTGKKDIPRCECQLRWAPQPEATARSHTGVNPAVFGAHNVQWAAFTWGVDVLPSPCGVRAHPYPVLPE